MGACRAFVSPCPVSRVVHAMRVALKESCRIFILPRGCFTRKRKRKTPDEKNLNIRLKNCIELEARGTRSARRAYSNDVRRNRVYYNSTRLEKTCSVAECRRCIKNLVHESISPLDLNAYCLYPPQNNAKVVRVRVRVIRNQSFDSRV